MSGKYLLDTNIVIALFANDEGVRNNLADASEIFIPSIVVGELFYGAWKSSRSKDNISRIDDLASRSAVLGCDAETAKIYGEIKYGLSAKEKPIPENGIWIAAVALRHGLILVSRDSHFSAVDGLALASW